MKKILTICAASLAMAVGGLLFAEDEDDFYIPLDIDFSAPVETADAGGEASSAPASKLKQGLWIEATSKTQSLIRDVASGEKSGYELDNSHFTSNANWWFWGELTPSFHLDAEISVWDFDKTIFQSNSYAANVADVTWGDGIQSLLTMPFSFINNCNDDGAGSFNKFAFNVTTPYVNIRTGYGQLKDNGMSKYEGIYNVIDRWLDVGKGYTELTLGNDVREIGDVKLDAVAALSQMRGTFGGYGYIDANWNDIVHGAVTVGSVTNSSELFYYNENMTNAVSAYFAYQAMDSLKLEAHALGTTGSSITFGLNSLAAAGRLTYSNEALNVSVMQSVAGEDVTSVWGSDGQSYDNINADTWTTYINLNWNLTNWAALVLDENLTLNDYDNPLNGLMTLRSQPIIDFDFSNLLGIGLTASAYGVVNVDRQSSSSSVRGIIPYFEEGAMEIVADGFIPGINKITFDYGVQFPWSGDDDKSYSAWYHSFMLNADITDKLNLHAAAVIRLNADGVEDSTLVPLGFAAGASLAGLPLPGSPKLWIHATYGMYPYSENNYSLYRADNYLNRPVHRTYLLDALDEDTTTSTIGIGLIWDL